MPAEIIQGCCTVTAILDRETLALLKKLDRCLSAAYLLYVKGHDEMARRNAIALQIDALTDFALALGITSVSLQPTFRVAGALVGANLGRADDLFKTKTKRKPKVANAILGRRAVAAAAMELFCRSKMKEKQAADEVEHELKAQNAHEYKASQVSQWRKELRAANENDQSAPVMRFRRLTAPMKFPPEVDHRMWAYRYLRLSLWN